MFLALVGVLPTIVFAVPADHVLVGAGDVAGKGGAQEATAGLILQVLDGGTPADVFTLGDNAYQSGELREYQAYFDPAWGKFKALIHPVPGNHEYRSNDQASGYFQYFGAAA